ncbi:MAG: hypothetical protein QOK15_2974 [Nocardioidaceae bacterium]|nr:hypothetical protein [Nocardioidaceae bacterium]
MSEVGDPLRRIAARASEQDPTSWFEQLYAAARTGSVTVPWDRRTAHPLLTEWTSRHAVDGRGRTAVVVGCGLGSDAEHLAGRGFATTAFDVSPTAVATAQERHPSSTVHYTIADLLALPRDWRSAYDLVVEALTVQSLPPPLHGRAIEAVCSLVAPDGTLVVVAGAHEEGEELTGPPWPLTRGEIDLFSTGELEATSIEVLPATDGGPGGRRWRVELRRPAEAGARDGAR